MAQTDAPATEAQESEQLYTPAPDELQLTVRAVLIGCALGGVVCAMNIYFGLRTGWSIGGSLIAAILSFSLFRSLQSMIPGMKPFSALETNIAQTAGSAAGSMTSAAGLLAAIPAMGMLGYQLSYLELTLWAASVAWLGVFYAVPLRRQMVLVERLRFPTGTATAQTILAMYSEGGDAEKKSRVLIGFGLAAAGFTIVAFFLNDVFGIVDIGHPPIETWLPIAKTPVPAIVTLPNSVLDNPRLMKLFLRHGPQQLTDVAGALARGEPDAVARAAHGRAVGGAGGGGAAGHAPAPAAAAAMAGMPVLDRESCERRRSFVTGHEDTRRDRS